MKFLCPLLLMLSTSAFAQSIVDTPAEINADLTKQTVNDVADEFSDPVSTQFRRLKPSQKYEGSICGQVNTKNAYGGYVGFTSFRYIPEKRKTYLINSGCE